MAQAEFDVPETVNKGTEMGPVLIGADSGPAGDAEALPVFRGWGGYREDAGGGSPAWELVASAV